jgi:hypothetical protein
MATFIVLYGTIVLADQTSPKNDLVTIYIPAFSGPDEIGLNVGTVLNLQIWRTLRKAANNKTFGRGLVVWSEAPLNTRSFDEVNEFSRVGLAFGGGKRVYPQLVFWGNARQFGSGIVVESFLSIPPAYIPGVCDGWDVIIPDKQGDFRIHADFPQHRYEFTPIVLKKELLEKYSKPTALQIYANPTSNVPIGEVGLAFEAREQREGGVILKSNGKVGWVPLPQLSENRNEVVDFVAGVIRIFRADWDGADALFDRVVKDTQASTTLRIDASLYQVMSKTKAGKDASQSLARAKELAPFYYGSTVYSVMAKLEMLGKAAPHSPMKVQSLMSEIKEELSKDDALFMPNDPWRSSVLSFLEQYGNE